MQDETICYCYGVTKKDIIDAIKNGAKTLEDIQDATGAGTACGRCNGAIGNILKQELKNKK